MLSLYQCGHAFRHEEGLLINRPAGTEFYVFVHYRTPSEVWLGGEWVAAQGQTILFQPGQPQMYRSAEAPFVNDWVHFYQQKTGAEEDFFASLAYPVNSLAPCVIPSKVGQAVRNLQESLVSGGKWAEKTAGNELENLFYRLLDSSAEKMGDPSYRQYYAVFLSLRSSLYSLPQAGTNVAELAGKAGLSPSYFQWMYKKYFGVSVGQDIVNSRLERACYLLENSGYPVHLVGRMSGYECEAHFLRQFKKWRGVTPGVYRKSGKEGEPDENSHHEVKA